MEEAPENGKELLHSAHANVMNEWMNVFHFQAALHQPNTDYRQVVLHTNKQHSTTIRSIHPTYKNSTCQTFHKTNWSYSHSCNCYAPACCPLCNIQDIYKPLSKQTFKNLHSSYTWLTFWTNTIKRNLQ